MSICPVPQDYYLVALQRSQIRMDDLFRMCTVLGIIIFSEIKRSIKAVSCPQAEIVVFWMHVLCPVNMICGSCFKVLPKSFFSWLSSLFKAGGPKYLNSKWFVSNWWCQNILILFLHTKIFFLQIAASNTYQSFGKQMKIRFDSRHYDKLSADLTYRTSL